MAIFLLEFKDLEPSLGSSQTAEYDSLEEAEASVVTAIRDIVADHIRHGRPLSMTSVTVSDEDGKTLSDITLADAISDLLPGLKPPSSYPAAANERASVSRRNRGFRIEMKRD